MADPAATQPPAAVADATGTAAAPLTSNSLLQLVQPSASGDSWEVCVY
jgi:hypothetical protein